MKTTAAVLRSFGGQHSIEEVELREPGPDEVLVRLVAAGVCHSDVGQADGEWGFSLPAVLGHEGAGVVESVGSRISVVPGQRVVLTLAPGCGRCMHCVIGRPILCQDSLDAMAEGRLTTGPSPITGTDGPIATYSLLGCFAHHAVVSGRSVIPLPDGIPADVAAVIGCAVITGLGAAIETLKVRAGSRGVVIGVGGVGLNAVQGACLCGAAQVSALDVSRDRLDQALRFGSTDVVDVTDADLVAALVRRAPREGFDWSIVTVGSVDAMRLGIDVIRPGGTAVIVGLAAENLPVAVDMLEVVTYEKTIKGSAYGTISPQVLLPQIFDLYLGGQLLLNELVSARLPLDRIDAAFDLSRQTLGIRPVLTLSEP